MFTMSMQVLLQPVVKPSMSDRIYRLSKRMVEHNKDILTNAPLIIINTRSYSEHQTGDITVNLTLDPLVDEAIAITQEIIGCSQDEAFIKLITVGLDIWQGIVEPTKIDLEDWEALALFTADAMKTAYKLEETQFSTTMVLDYLMNRELARLINGAS